MTRRLLIVVLAVVAVSVQTAAARAQQTTTTLAELGGPTGLTAYVGRVLWSTLDPSTGAYRLTQRYRGITSTLPVAPRAAAFDADLGTDAQGRTVAVYSRCSAERGASDPRTPRWDQARGCRIYEFSFATGQQRRVAGLARGDASEFLPSMWRGRLAYALIERPGGSAKLMLGHRRVRGGTRRVCGKLLVGRKVVSSCPPLVAPQPSALDLSARGLAIVWQHGGAVRSQTPHLDVRPAWTLLVDGNDGTQRVVNHASAGEGNLRYLLGGSWDRGWLYSARACFDECNGGFASSGLFRSRAGQGRPASAPSPAPGRLLTAVAVDGATLYYAQGSCHETDYGCEPAAPFTVSASLLPAFAS